MDKPLVFLLCIISLGLCVNTSRVQAAVQDEPSKRCIALQEANFSGIPDAPTSISNTRVVESTEETVGYCEVAGYIVPNVQFVLWMPLGDWKGRFIEIGCGGLCGYSWHVAGCDEPLRRGYACIVSDGGHRSLSHDAMWAYNNLPGMIDLFVRAPHVVALAGKAIIKRYLGQDPRKSYFWGCSGGGSQAMQEAQRFPWDFDGIIAGAAIDWAWSEVYYLWANRALVDEAGRSLLSQSDLQLVHDAVVKKCDMNDGLKDGLIGDPRKCGFEPEELQCRAGPTSSCLNARQVEAIRKIYGGPVTSDGQKLPSKPTALMGTELQWSFFAGPEMYNLIGDWFRYFNMFYPAPGPTWKPEYFDFNRDYKRVGMLVNLLEPNNPDLRTFRSAGGKLLHYAGWSDIWNPTLREVDYYETVERLMGSRSTTQDFYRLFVLPGARHCEEGGEGAWAVDYLTAMEAWVEKGEAPSKLIALHAPVEKVNLETGAIEVRREVKSPFQVAPLFGNPKWDPATVDFSRPIYPYPMDVKYLGHGDPRSAASFGPSR